MTELGKPLEPAFQSANNRVFNSKGRPFSPFAANNLQPFSANLIFDPLFFSKSHSMNQEEVFNCQ